MPTFCCLLDAATFEVNMKNHSKDIHSQDITLKQFQQQLTVTQNKKTLISSTFIEEKIFDIF